MVYCKKEKDGNLVEDETALSEALSEILNQNGYLTDCVSNGIDGL